MKLEELNKSRMNIKYAINIELEHDSILQIRNLLSIFSNTANLSQPKAVSVSFLGPMRGSRELRLEYSGPKLRSLNGYGVFGSFLIKLDSILS